MNVRCVMIAAAAMLAATGVAAEPAQPPRPSPQADPSPPQLLLASADEVRSPPPSDQQAATAPKRPRVARVTTCRCGDPQTSAQQDQ